MYVNGYMIRDNFTGQKLIKDTDIYGCTVQLRSSSYKTHLRKEYLKAARADKIKKAIKKLYIVSDFDFCSFYNLEDK